MDEQEKQKIIADLIGLECHIYRDDYTGPLKQYYPRISDVFERVVAEPVPNETNIVQFVQLVERRNNWEEAKALAEIWREAVRTQDILPRYFKREETTYVSKPAWPLVDVESPQFPSIFDAFKPKEPGQ